MRLLRGRLGIETEKVPAALWVFVVVSVVWGFVAIAVDAALSKPLLIPLLLGIPLSLGFAWLILRRSRVVWCLIVFGSAVTFVTLPFSPTPWWNVALAAFDLCLLLPPPTRRFIWRDRPDALTPQEVTADPVAIADPDRKDGWYLDPDNPMWMRYWSSSAGEWLGRTKTPRKVRKARPAGGRS